MYRRFVLAVLFGVLLAALACPARAGDSVSIKLLQFGLQGIYSEGGPTLVSAAVRNVAPEPLSFELEISEVVLSPSITLASERIVLPLTLAPGEERALNVPLHIAARDHAVLYLEARDARGLPIGRTGGIVGPKTDGHVIALLCATQDLGRRIRQTILLSGSAEEQTHKSKTLHLVQLTEPLSEGWAYARAGTVILAIPAARLSATQQDALELYLKRGGKLVLVEDQLADGLAFNPAARKRTSADLMVLGRNSFFLEPYRSRLPFGKTLTVGSGELTRLPAVSSKDFADYFRPLGFTQNTPTEIFNAFQRWRAGDLILDHTDHTVWLMKRLGTSFRFPSFLEILLWMLGYLFLVGVVNFVLLRRLGHPEWAWLTLPALAVLVSVLLYVTSARNRPRNFGLDDMVVYQMDNVSSLATAQARVRISAPFRAQVRPSLPANWIYTFRGPYPGGEFSFPGYNLASLEREIRLTNAWETQVSLRKWSFKELNFESQRVFPGTVFRNGRGHLHNSTGVSYQQSIVVDHEDVFLLGDFPAGADVDLGHVPRRPYHEETGRALERNPGYPGYPGAPFGHPSTDRREGRAVSEADTKKSEAEWAALSTQPFSLLELIRGWSNRGDDVFSETKAVFFGLSHDALPGASLRDLSPERKSYSLTIVTFWEWP